MNAKQLFLRKHGVTQNHMALLEMASVGKTLDGRSVKVLVRKECLSQPNWRITHKGLDLLAAYNRCSEPAEQVIVEKAASNQIIILTMGHLLKQLTEQETKLSKALMETRHMRESLMEDYQI